MSNTGKFYVISLDIYNKMADDIAKLPLQQQQILKCLAAQSKPMKGSEIVDLAKKKFSLVTKQKSTVLYAWYARSNENYGVRNSRAPAPVTGPTEIDLIAAGTFAE